jgi:hypothetical protein
MSITPEKTIIGGLVTVIGACALLTAFDQPRSTATAQPPAPAQVQEPFDASAAEVYCSSAIKDKLSDPESLRILKTKVINPRLATFAITAKNGFGGTVRGFVSCEATPNGTGFDTTATVR